MWRRRPTRCWRSTRNSTSTMACAWVTGIRITRPTGSICPANRWPASPAFSASTPTPEGLSGQRRWRYRFRLARRLVGILAIAAAEGAAQLGEAAQARLNPAIEGIRGIVALGVGRTGGHAGEDLDGLVDVLDRVESKLPRSDGVQYLLAQDQVDHVGLGN